MPSLDDDGHTVTVDLHGLPVREAERLADAALHEAAARGRSSLKLVHGSSTSDRQYRNRTIKHVVQDLAATHPAVTGTLRSRGHLTCSLDVTAHRDRSRLTLRDVW